MFQSIEQVRRWLVASAITLIVIVGLSYWISRSRTLPALHNVPKQLGLDIQQTSDGFSISKSEGGRTIYTIRASNAVQFKEGGHADLKNVHIVVYGKSHDRYDQIYGNQFVYDQVSATSSQMGKFTSTSRAMRKDRRSPTRRRPTS